MTTVTSQQWQEVWKDMAEKTSLMTTVENL